MSLPGQSDFVACKLNLQARACVYRSPRDPTAALPLPPGASIGGAK